MKWESLFIWNDDITKCFFRTIHISFGALFVPCTLNIVNTNIKKDMTCFFNITYTSHTKIHQERTICLVIYPSYYKQNKSSKNQTINFSSKVIKKVLTWNKCKSQFKQSYRNKNIRNKPPFLLHSSYKYVPACFYCIQQKTIYNYAVFDTFLHKLFSHSGNRVLFLPWIYIERQFKSFFLK